MNEIINSAHIENRIFNIRGQQLMLDSHLAELYDVETKTLNQAVKRNIQRFPEQFRFQLTDIEWENLRSQFVTSSEQNLRFQNDTSKRGGRRYNPYVFTEQGVSMLSAVLRSETAVKVSIQIMQAFVQMRQFITSNALLFQRMDTLEMKQAGTDEKVGKILKAIELGEAKPKQGIFYNGQIFDAYLFISDLVKNAESSIILIDNYIDESILHLFAKAKPEVTTTIFTYKKSKQLELDLSKYNSMSFS